MLFFFNDTATTEIYTLSLHDALPIWGKPDGLTLIEQRALAAFLKAHRNITGYFHGHSNWTEFYTWPGPDGDLSLSVFRYDSPMKGKVSGKDETKLAFQVVVFDGKH